MTRRCAHFVLFAVWLLALAAGWWLMTQFQYASETASADSLAPRWPADSKLASAPNRPTVVLFLHPRCPCSRASLTELEGLFAKLQNERIALPDVHVVATVPEIYTSESTETENVHRARQLPNARVFIDRGGVEARRFAAVTSGTMIVFDASARRQYTGGVTVARGLEGQNAGVDAIESLLRGKPALASNMPVFGCRLCLPPQDPIAKAIAVSAASRDVAVGRASTSE